MMVAVTVDVDDLVHLVRDYHRRSPGPPETARPCNCGHWRGTGDAHPDHVAYHVRQAQQGRIEL